MPSDERVQRALASIKTPLAVFRSAAVRSLARVEGVMSSASTSERAALELGAFASGRIDGVRFATLSRGVAFDAAARARLAKAADVLREITATPDESFVTELRSGEALDRVVQSTLSSFGRAFGAVTAADLVRTERYRAAQHDSLAEAWGFDRWTTEERRQAPPIVVTLDGADLHAGTLAHLLDGDMHIVLVVRGACPPASLVRLITPNTLVLQTNDATGLDRFAAYSGPAIAALVSDDAACFLHDPERGRAPWQRLNVWHRPAADPRRSIAGCSPAQLRDELRQLEALAERPSINSTPVDGFVPAGSGDPADRLASWLLAQSGIDGVN